MRFSIVLTTTRPHLLKDSLRAALAQSYDNYEIVVSDNSKEGSEAFVRSFNSERIRYVRPQESMRVAAHWDFAFGQAQGDWVMQLCDDDAITPNALTLLAQQVAEHPNVQAMCWNYGVYRRSGHWSRKDQIGIGQYSGQANEYDAKELLAAMFNSGTGLFQIKAKIPFYPRCAIRKDILDAIRARQGSLFHRFCPMTSGAAAVLSFADRTLHLDMPLTILGETEDSIAGWVVNAAPVTAYIEGTEVELAPVKLARILPTGQAEALLRTQRAMPERLGQYRLNELNHFLHCYLFIREAEGRGVNMADCWPAYNEALAKMPGEFQTKVAALAQEHLAQKTPSVMNQFKHFVRTKLDPFLPARLPGEADATRLGLHDIVECAACVGAMIDAGGRPNVRLRVLSPDQVRP